jgi:hypothetical protein
MEGVGCGRAQYLVQYGSSLSSGWSTSLISKVEEADAMESKSRITPKGENDVESGSYQ